MWAYVKGQVMQQLLQKRQIPQEDNNNAQDDLADGGASAPAQPKA